MQYFFEGVSYTVEVIRKKSNRNTYLRIKPDHVLQVTTNSFTSDRAILKIIEQNTMSIRRMIEKQMIREENNDGFSYLGRKYDVVYCDGDVNEITFGEQKVFFAHDFDVERYYKKEAKELFRTHFDACYQRFSRKIPYPTLKIRKMKSRWGVCNPSKKIVTLNLELIKRDPVCLDYVIIHELSHLLYPNHQAEFWALVEENCPSYRQTRRQMKTY